MGKEYVDRGEMLFRLETGFFPQDVEYTEAVSIARDIIKSAPTADVVPRSEVAKIENEAWDRGWDACIESGYREASTVTVETLIDVETRITQHFGTYTEEDVVKVSDVFKLINRITLEILEDENDG